MKFLERLLLSFLPTDHRVVDVKNHPDVVPLGEWIFLALVLLCTSYLWPVAGVIEALGIETSFAIVELKALGLALLIDDILPLMFFAILWRVIARDLNARQRSRLLFMTWLPAVYVRILLQGVPLIFPKVAYYPLPILSIPQLVALSEAFMNIVLLVIFLPKSQSKPFKIPLAMGIAFAFSFIVISGILFVYPLVLSLPRFVVAPDFNIPAMNDGHCQLSTHRGRPVVLEFWNQHCPHCRRLIPEMEKLAQSMGNNIDILSVHTGGGEQSAKRVAELVGNARFTICLDDGTATKAYKALSPPHRPEGVPHVVFIDRNGIIRRSASGYRSVDILRAEVQQSGILR